MKQYTLKLKEFLAYFKCDEIDVRSGCTIKDVINYDLLYQFFKPFDYSEHKDTKLTAAYKNFDKETLIKTQFWHQLAKLDGEREISFEDLVKLAQKYNIPVADEKVLARHWQRVALGKDGRDANEQRDEYFAENVLQIRPDEFEFWREREYSAKLVKFQYKENSGKVDEFLDNTVPPTLEIRSYLFGSPISIPQGENASQNSRAKIVNNFLFGSPEQPSRQQIEFWLDRTKGTDVIERPISKNQMLIQYMLTTAFEDRLTSYDLYYDHLWDIAQDEDRNAVLDAAKNIVIAKEGNNKYFNDLTQSLKDDTKTQSKGYTR